MEKEENQNERLIIKNTDSIGFKKKNIREDYKFTSKLGSGAYGVVYQARNRKTGEIRAVKAVRKKTVEDIESFKNEIEIMKALDHPGIIKLMEVYENNDWIFFVQELCQGGELFYYITKKQNLSEDDAALVMEQIFGALQYCHHNNICHRDLKPENFLLKNKDDLNSIKLIDFGLSKKLSKNEHLNDVNGTPFYIAPEILEGNYDQQCDMWSLGVILYILLCGVPPFTGKTHKHILRKVKKGVYEMDRPQFKKCSPEVLNLIQGLLVKDPDQRLTSKQAYEHKWVQREVEQQSKALKIDPTVIGELECFMKAQTLKKVILMRVAQQIPEEEIIHLKNIFKDIDKNGNGLISQEELIQGIDKFSNLGASNLTQEDGKRLFEAIDIDFSGEIDYTEFIASFMGLKLKNDKKYLRQTFEQFDQNGDGFISKEELLAVLTKDGSNLHAFDEINQIIEQADKDGDGQINYQEMIVMMDDLNK